MLSGKENHYLYLFSQIILIRPRVWVIWSGGLWARSLQGICSLVCSVKPGLALPSPFLPGQTLFRADGRSARLRECRCEAGAARGPTFEDVKDRIPTPPCVYNHFPEVVHLFCLLPGPCPPASQPGASMPVSCVPVRYQPPLQAQIQCSSGASPVLKTGTIMSV